MALALIEYLLVVQSAMPKGNNHEISRGFFFWGCELDSCSKARCGKEVNYVRIEVRKERVTK